MKPSLVAALALASSLALAGSAQASFPSVLDGLFPVDSSQFPGQGACVADGTSGVGVTPFGWLAPPCQIDPTSFFAGNPQFIHVVSQVTPNPVFGTAGSVPEPGSFLLVALGLAGLGWAGRRR